MVSHTRSTVCVWHGRCLALFLYAKFCGDGEAVEGTKLWSVGGGESARIKLIFSPQRQLQDLKDRTGSLHELDVRRSFWIVFGALGEL